MVSKAAGNAFAAAAAATRARESPDTLPPMSHPRAGSGGDGAGPSSAAQQQLQQPVVMLPDGRLQQPARLGAVVDDALRRWYAETEKEALRGDVVRACALLHCRANPGTRLLALLCTHTGV